MTDGSTLPGMNIRTRAQTGTYTENESLVSEFSITMIILKGGTCVARFHNGRFLSSLIPPLPQPARDPIYNVSAFSFC